MRMRDHPPTSPPLLVENRTRFDITISFTRDDLDALSRRVNMIDSTIGNLPAAKPITDLNPASFCPTF
jgi:hypothetical protein